MNQQRLTDALWGRVAACRCFLPKRFAAFFAAIAMPSPGRKAPGTIIGSQPTPLCTYNQFCLYSGS
jgi:hypothetical protein